MTAQRWFGLLLIIAGAHALAEGLGSIGIGTYRCTIGLCLGRFGLVAGPIVALLGATAFF